MELYIKVPALALVPLHTNSYNLRARVRSASSSSFHTSMAAAVAAATEAWEGGVAAAWLERDASPLERPTSSACARFGQSLDTAHGHRITCWMSRKVCT